jgi:DNA-binding transcriptional regulator YhcF (GntR family)
MTRYERWRATSNAPHDVGMKIRLDPASPVPLSVQLRERIAARVIDGRLLPGERLPTVRALAAELGLAANTVAKAYRELEASGLLTGRGRHGTFVVERLPDVQAGADALLGEAADAYVRRSRQLGVSTAEARRAVDRALERP